MHYTVVHVPDEVLWENFLSDIQPHSFLHSWKWGVQYESLGSKIWRVGVYEENHIVAVALIIKIVARRGTFLYCPHGPLIAQKENRQEILKKITEFSKEIAMREKCDFMRFCPLDHAAEENSHRYQVLGFRPAPIHMHPEKSWMLDITKNEETLLKEMRKTTRYLIKKSEKEGVEVIQSTNVDDIELFWPVYQATVTRQQFAPFPKTYLRKEFKVFSEQQGALFFFGKYQGTIISAAIIIFYKNSAFYHHSGSLQSFAHINASSLLQWRVIQEAKRRGCTLYNFWGISPDNKPKHPWAGLSLFKKGFGGFAEDYLHAQDLPLTKKYWLNFIIESVRRIKRGV